jgi:DNA-directed RNA polymerase specialized sigma24 family protein
MSDTDAVVRSLGERLKAHDEDAAVELLALFGPLLRRLVAHAMSRRLRRRIDNDDLLQDVLERFLMGLQDTDFSSYRELVAFFKVLVGWVAGDAHRIYLSPTHFPRTKVVSLDEAAARDEAAFAVHVLTPQELAEFEAELHRIAQGLPFIEQVLVLIRDGHALKAIASQLGLAPRTLNRLLQQFRQQVVAAWRDGSGGP